MTASLEALAARSLRLHALGLPGGLSAEATERLCQGLSRGEPLLALGPRVGLDPRLTAAVSAAGVADVPAALDRLCSTLGRAAVAERTLRGAGLYPLLVAFSVMLPGFAVALIGMPSLARLPGGHAPVIGVWIAVGIATCLLVVLSAGTLLRARGPLFGVGWARCEGAAFADSLVVFVRAGVPLPRALRGAGAWLSPNASGQAEAAAAALEAGRSPGPVPALFDPFEAGLLFAAARHGALIPSAVALADHRLRRLDRSMGAAVLRVQLVTLCLAGSSVLVVGATFFWGYFRAVLG